MAKSLHVQIIGDSRSYSRALGSATRETQTFGSKSSGVFRSVGRAAAFSAGSAGVGALTIALHAGISEWTEGTRVAAQTAQVLKTTGGVANVTAKEVDALATAIQNKSGIDDEAIKTTENLLLGFTNIRNEVGKGNDIFTRATKIVTDYSVRTGKNASGAAIIFGKALQDPLKNMGALSRAVGGLSAAQKAQIKTMVESGNTIGAQKLLLVELEKRFGGAADAAGKTLPGQLDILRERFRNLAGQGVGIAIAKLQEMAPTILGVARVIGSFMDVLAPLASLMFDVIVTPMKVIFALLRGDWAAAWDAAKKPVMDMVAVVEGVWNHLQGLVLPALAAITGAFTTAWATIRTLTTSAWTAITGAITTALNTIANLTRTILASISGIFTTAWNAVQTLTTSAWATITGAITTALTAIGGVVTTAFGAMQTGVTSGMTAIANAMATAWNGIKAAAKGAWDAVIGFITSAVGRAVTEATAVGAGILRGVSNGITGLVSMVQGWFQSLWAWIKGAAGSAYAFALNIGKDMVQGVIDGITHAAHRLWDAAGGLIDGAKKKLEFWKSPPGAYGEWLGTELVNGIIKALRGGGSAAGAAAGNFVTSIKGPLLKGMNTVGQLIIAAAKKYGVDARAALAVAMGEGGIKFGAVGDSGHAFGPFQMNNAGGVLTGMDSAKADRYANSVEGINAALRGMAAAGARGKVGLDAITTIISKYERPLNVAASIQNAIAAFKTLGPGVASAIKSGGAAVTGAQTRILTGLVNLAKQYGPIIGIEQVRGIIRGLDASQPGFLAAARKGMADAQTAMRLKILEGAATVGDAFGQMADRALAAFDAKVATWKNPLTAKLTAMQNEDAAKQGAEGLAGAMETIFGGNAADTQKLAASIGATLSEAMSKAMGAIAGAKTQQALSAAAGTASQQMTAAINAAAAPALAQAQNQVTIAQTALDAAIASGDQEAITKATTDLNTAVTNQQTLATAVRGEIERQTGVLATAVDARHEAIAARDRIGLSKQLTQLGTELAKHPGEWNKMAVEVQKTLAKYDVKFQAAGKTWAEKFADGIKSGKNFVTTAVQELVTAALAQVHQSPPKEGPLAGGTVERAGKLLAKEYAVGITAASGLVSSAMSAMLGAGLSGGRLGGLSTGGGSLAMAGVSAGGGATTINVYVTGSVTTEQELSEAIYRNLERRGRRNVSIFNR